MFPTEVKWQKYFFFLNPYSLGFQKKFLNSTGLRTFA